MSDEGTTNTQLGLMAAGPIGWAALPMAKGGGKGGGGGGNGALDQIALRLENESRAPRTQFLSQGNEALLTGGVGAQIPLITRMVESAKSALSKSLQETEYGLGSVGLSKTPFGQSILAQSRISGEAGIADIGPRVAMDFIKMLPAFMGGQTGQAVSGLSSSAAADATKTASQNQAFAQIMSKAIPSVSFTNA